MWSLWFLRNDMAPTFSFALETLDLHSFKHMGGERTINYLISVGNIFGMKLYTLHSLCTDMFKKKTLILPIQEMVVVNNFFFFFFFIFSYKFNRSIIKFVEFTNLIIDLLYEINIYIYIYSLVPLIYPS
jgi:hypothetical protein